MASYRRTRGRRPTPRPAPRPARSRPPSRAWCPSRSRSGRCARRRRAARSGRRTSARSGPCESAVHRVRLPISEWPCSCPANACLQVAQGGEVGGVGRGLPGRGLEPGTAPGLLVGLDEERAPAARVRVGMRDERAVLGLDRREYGVGRAKSVPHHRYRPRPVSMVPPKSPSSRVALLIPSAAITMSASRSPARRRAPYSSRTPAFSACRCSTASSSVRAMPISRSLCTRTIWSPTCIVMSCRHPAARMSRSVFRVRELKVALGAGGKPDPEAERDTRFTLFVARPRRTTGARA